MADKGLHISRSDMRVALVSTGLGRVLRGFEAFTESLFLSLRVREPELDLTLFQGGGQSGNGRIVVPNFHRSGYPARWFSSLNASHWENRSFALAIFPRLRMGNYDVVHYNELTMGSALFHMRRMFGGKFKLLYCNGSPSPPIHYHHRCDFAQVLTEPHYEEALEFGMPAHQLFSLPYGVDADLFHPDRKRNRSAIRSELGVPQEAHIVLSVATIKREHKRIEYLIQEIVRLSPESWLVVAGQKTDDTAHLECVADQLMPGRWRFVTWPRSRVADLYGAADVFVLCSLTEAFGLVTIEAMLSELPVVIHNGPVFRWVAQGTSAQLIDMEAPGALVSALRDTSLRPLSSDQHALHQTREAARRRFSWKELVRHYLAMYRAVTSH